VYDEALVAIPLAVRAQGVVATHEAGVAGRIATERVVADKPNAQAMPSNPLNKAPTWFSTTALPLRLARHSRAPR
jgi:hypothetical protein